MGVKTTEEYKGQKEKPRAGIEGGKFNLCVIYCPVLTIWLVCAHNKEICWQEWDGRQCELRLLKWKDLLSFDIHVSRTQTCTLYTWSILEETRILKWRLFCRYSLTKRNILHKIRKKSSTNCGRQFKANIMCNMFKRKS